MKKQKGMTLKDEIPSLVSAQYATGKSGEITPERIEAEPKQKQHLLVDVTGDGNKVWCCEEQYA